MLTSGLRFGVFLLLFAASLAAAGDSIISVPHRVAEPMELLRDIPEPARLRSKNLPHIWRHQQHLSPPSGEEVRKGLGPPDQVPPRVGFNRPVGSSASPLDLGPSLGWEYLADGAWLAVLEVESPGARSLRAGIHIGSLPDGLELRFFGRDAETVHVVLGSEVMRIIERNRAVDGDTSEANTYWSPVIDGDRIGVELHLPRGQDPARVRATFQSVSHLVYSPFSAADDEFQQRIGGSAFCNVDVMCHPDWDISRRAVARMLFTVGSSSRLCTGTLLNSISGVPYFLTAEHCISSQSAASSLNTFWFYRSTACNSGVLSSGTATRIGGAGLVYAGPGNDTTLLLLNDRPPAGAVYAGWTTAAPVLSETATGIHHPVGDLQKINLGAIRQFMNCTADDANGNFTCSLANSSTGEYIDAYFTQGVTQGGSSGSALFAPSEPYVIGVLRGGNSSCANPSGNNVYGRFGRAFAAGNLGQWLVAPPSTLSLTVTRQGNGTGTVTSQPAGIACGSSCTANFDAGTTVSLSADPAAGSVFVEWGEACSGSASCSVEMNLMQAVTATFGVGQNLQDNRFFVEQQYRDFLGREGDVGGIDFWTGELEAGRITRAQVADDFFRSAEFQENIAPVARLYFAYFNRIPDYAGLTFWVSAFQSGGSLDGMSQAFADSAEFRSRYGALNDGAFVDLVYQNVLGRLPDAGGRAFWVSQLAAGLSRGAMMIGFSESEEYRQRSFQAVQVTMMYVSMLRRAPEQEGFDFWVAELAVGGSILDLIGGFLDSAEYADRFAGGGGGGGSEPLAAPQSLQATAGSGTVALQWLGVSGAGGYALYYATAGGIQPANFGIWMSQHGGVMIENVTSPHAVAGLDNGTQYFFVVTATAGGVQESGPSNEVSAVPHEAATVTGKLNDTGIDWCADGSSNNLSCPVAGYLGQDGEFGRDAAARAGTLEKVGDGAAGFDYTKISNSGAELPASATLGNGPNDWACTRDNVTGLIWEVKVNNSAHLRHQSHNYTWYDPASPDGNPGTQNGGSCVGSACDTTGFKQAVQIEGLCGASDWRMPTPRELEGIVDYGRNNPAIDTGHFPNTPSSGFKSGSPHAGDSNGAWGVSFDGGGAYGYFRSSSGRVRLVRGGQ